MQITVVIDSFEELGKLKAMLGENVTANSIKQVSNDSKCQETDDKKGRKPIDAGKIKALRKAGWSVDAIADEMRCSRATVYKCLHQ